MSLISIVGRKIFDAPVPGDIELVEMGAAVAIASFLPLCEIKGMNITADAFTLWAPEPLKRLLDAVAHGLLMFASGVLAWRTAVQVSVYREYGDVSTLLSVPMWIPLLFIVPSLILLSLCAFARMLTVVQNEKGVS
ncbi:MAG: TRAP transporter small permease [Lautropia sp.]|nr:TRAP transporter small permease [Lautropia sp.]